MLTHFYREIDRAGAADGLPAFDITRNCKPETAGASIEGPESCTKDETDAKNQLAKRWSSYSASQKKECVGESTTGGEKSYVELLTYLEMSTGHFSTGADPNRWAKAAIDEGVEVVTWDK